MHMAVIRMTHAIVRILGKKMEKMMKLAKMLIGNSEKRPATPIGCLAVYVGEEAKRFVVPLRFLSHPLFKVLLEKAKEEYGFEQRRGLVIPCSVWIFQEVVRVVDCCHGQFDFEKLALEFL